MRKRARLLGALAALLLAFTGCSSPSPEVDSDDDGALIAPRVGASAPDFSLTTLQGEDVDLAALRGSPTWIVFNATWCAACRAEAPDVQAVHDAVGEDASILGVYMGEDGASVAGFADRVGLTYTQAADADQEVSRSYGVVGVPQHFFLDAEGTVVAVVSGGLTEEAALEYLAEAGLP